jgi:DNA-binding IclR family transcriptional regulator
VSTVPAARQVLAVLGQLARAAEPVPAAALSRALGLPRSTTYHLLSTLVEAGFVAHLPEERRYGLGLAAYELGTGYLRQDPLRRLAAGPVAALVDRVGESAHLAVLHGRDVLYVIEERAAGRPALVTDVGLRLPAQLTASGRAILAALPAAQARAAFAPGLPAGPRTATELRSVLAAVRRRGWAEEDGEVTEGFSSVAAAVLDHAGHPAAAVALTFVAAGVDPDRRAALADRTRRTAATISRRLTPTPAGRPATPGRPGPSATPTPAAGRPAAPGRAAPSPEGRRNGH